MSDLDLLVIRHAVAFERDPQQWPDDTLRPLTKEGEKDFRRAARALGGLTKPPRSLLSSPHERSWRTAEILTEEARWPAPSPFEPLEQDRHAEHALAALAARNDEGRLALVGHEPMLGLLCGILLGGGPIELKKGAVARLQVRALEPGGAKLRWLLPQKMLRLARR
jgi:phosphohistidine phosphatase